MGYSEPNGGRAASDQAEFAYTVSGFTGPFSWLVLEAHGHWVFAKAGDSTRVIWTYGFQATSILTRPVVGLLARSFWKAYMRDGLMHFKALAEQR